MLLEIMPDEHLKACPYCGNSDKKKFFIRLLMTTRESWNLICNNCEAEGPRKATREAAVKGYNNRHEAESVTFLPIFTPL